GDLREGFESEGLRLLPGGDPDALPPRGILRIPRTTLAFLAGHEQLMEQEPFELRRAPQPAHGMRNLDRPILVQLNDVELIDLRDETAGPALVGRAVARGLFCSVARGLC